MHLEGDKQIRRWIRDTCCSCFWIEKLEPVSYPCIVIFYDYFTTKNLSGRREGQYGSSLCGILERTMLQISWSTRWADHTNIARGLQLHLRAYMILINFTTLFTCTILNCRIRPAKSDFKSPAQWSDLSVESSWYSTDSDPCVDIACLLVPPIRLRLVQQVQSERFGHSATRSYRVISPPIPYGSFPDHADVRSVFCLAAHSQANSAACGTLSLLFFLDFHLAI